MEQNKEYVVAIIGATGLVGTTFLKVLEEVDFKIKELILYASSNSKGKKVTYKNKEYVITELKEETIDPNIEIAFFSAGKEISLKYAPLFAKNKTVVIDNSSAFREDKLKKLIVPEVNGHILSKEDLIIANPNCSTIASMRALQIINQLFTLKSVMYHTYQATSGSGYKGLEDLENKGNPKFYPVPIYNNILPHIDDFLEDGYTKEEHKMIVETKKILGLEDILVFATCVRVPVDYGHSVATYVTCENKIDYELLEEAFQKDSHLKYYQRPSYPTILEVKHTNDVLLGRLRIDRNNKKGLSFFATLDNVRKGAATNAIEIALYLIKENLI